MLSLLSFRHHLSRTVQYLNQFFEDSPDDCPIDYLSWDMAKCAKSRDGNVLQQLEKLATNAMRKTGLFHAGPQKYMCDLRPGLDEEAIGGKPYGRDHPGRYQVGFCLCSHPTSKPQSPPDVLTEVPFTVVKTGILRVNCIDCLDRTNTAQFMLGLNALRVQLYVLGVIERPEQLRFDSDAYHLLEEVCATHLITVICLVAHLNAHVVDLPGIFRSFTRITVIPSRSNMAVHS